MPPDATRVATVYTNAPKRIREAIFIDLCTLLRRHPGGDAHAALAVTQPPTHTNSRSLRQLHAKHGMLPLMEGEDGRHDLMGPRTALELGARRFRPRRAGDVLAARGVLFGLGVTTLPRFRCTVDRPGSSGP